MAKAKVKAKTARKAASRRKVAPSRTSAARKSAKPGKKAAKPAAARRAKPAASARSRAKPPARTKRRAPQTFTFSHLNDGSFESGLRRYAQYRDLGFAAATDGLAQAHVIRFVPPCRPEEVSKLHIHDVEFQMVYVLNGWIKSEFEGHGAVKMEKGSSWIQPPKIKHKVLDYSDDCEVLEIILPAQFETIELE
jgi:hypothetical protein